MSKDLDLKKDIFAVVLPVFLHVTRKAQELIKKNLFKYPHPHHSWSKSSRWDTYRCKRYQSCCKFHHSGRGNFHMGPPLQNWKQVSYIRYILWQTCILSEAGASRAKSGPQGQLYHDPTPTHPLPPLKSSFFLKHILKMRIHYPLSHISLVLPLDTWPRDYTLPATTPLIGSSRIITRNVVK